jgi:hypothetical protein
MPDILVAADEIAVTKIINAAEAALGKISRPPGSDSLGPFVVGWGASASFIGGTVDLIAPDVVRLQNISMNYTLDFTFKIDLEEFFGDVYLDPICLDLGDFGEICTPKICIPWPPPISVPIPTYSGSVTFTADFRPKVFLDGTQWVIEIEIVRVPSLEFDLATTAILELIRPAVATKLALIPGIGLFLAGAVDAILLAIEAGNLLGLLGAILTPFVSGLHFEIYRRNRLFEVLPASSPLDPAVTVMIDSLTAAVQSTDKDELVVTADISA